MKHVFFKFALLLSLLVSQSDGTASIEVVEFETTSQEKRYRDLIEELRCLVCQNQNLAGSDAPLAKDLREIAAQMIKQGDSDADIKKFMRSRYGDFVLYEPPFNWSTAFLWLGPFILLLLVIMSLILNIKRRQQEELFKPTHANNDADQIKIRNLMRDTPSLKPEESKKPKR